MQQEIERDRYGRPLIQKNNKKTPYTRVSTLAKTLDDHTSLENWKLKTVLKGIAHSKYLYTTLLANQSMPECDEKELLSIAQEALKAGGSTDYASIGTALHQLTEQIDAGNNIIPGVWEKHLDCYREAMQDIEILENEVFVCNDRFEYAGSFDKLVRLPGSDKVYIADLKTGTHDADYPSGVSTQIGLYANSLRYDVQSFERKIIHPDLDFDTGILIHMPAKKSPSCSIYYLDIKKGFERGLASIRAKNSVTISKKTVKKLKEIKK